MKRVVYLGLSSGAYVPLARGGMLGVVPGRDGGMGAGFCHPDGARSYGNGSGPPRAQRVMSNATGVQLANGNTSRLLDFLCSPGT